MCVYGFRGTVLDQHARHEGQSEPIHAKAMPVLLTTDDEADQWLTAPVEEALELQRPLPSDQMMIVAKGERKDEAA